jgi:class 3 adenylate cyclase
LAAPPGGTITFLFTDIEGSTRMWEKSPEKMRAALAHHDVVLRSAIEAHGGYVFKTVGDAFCAAFKFVQYGGWPKQRHAFAFSVSTDANCCGRA